MTGALIATRAMRRLRWITAASVLLTAGVSRLPAQSPYPPKPGIVLEVGPCFGFCPIYQVAISPDGKITYRGERHTAVVGERRRTVGTKTYAAIARMLTPFRPPVGSVARVPCGEAVSDTPTYTVSWIGSDRRVTTATLQTRCRSGEAAVMERIIRNSLARLRIDRWSRQTSVPDAIRG